MESRSASNGIARVRASLGQVREILVQAGPCSIEGDVSDTRSWLARPFPVHTANSHYKGWATPRNQLRQAGPAGVFAQSCENSRCGTQDARCRSGELLCFLNTSREISWEKRPVQCARDGFVCPPDCVGFSHGCSTTAGFCFPLGREWAASSLWSLCSVLLIRSVNSIGGKL